jgi:hypothetical protein
MSRCMLAAAFGGALVVTLGACANMSDMQDDGPTSVTYTCEDGKTFLAMFSEDRERSFVRTDDETYELDLVDRDGDEFEYQDRDGVQLTVDDDDNGHLAIPGDDEFENCTSSTT